MVTEKQPVYDEPPTVPGVEKNDKPKPLIPIYAPPTKKEN